MHRRTRPFLVTATREAAAAAVLRSILADSVAVAVAVSDSVCFVDGFFCPLAVLFVVSPSAPAAGDSGSAGRPWCLPPRAPPLGDWPQSGLRFVAPIEAGWPD